MADLKLKCPILKPGTLERCTKEINHAGHHTWFKPGVSAGPSVYEVEAEGNSAPKAAAQDVDW